MVESHFGTEKIEKRVGEGVHKGEQQLEFRKDPSFAGWYNEDGIPHSNHGLENMDANVEDFDFELSAIQQEGSDSGSLYGEGILYSSIQKREMLMNDGNDTNDVSTHDGPNRHEKCVAFDIENESKRELNFSKFDAYEPSCINAHEISQSKSRVSISIADVLKTLFFILVWYTFSTFLTLYNKTLLGDDLGKFPAPMLMNTIHFGMQAVLSKAITWYWSKKFQSVVSMSWRDYFVRVVPTALGTALDINLSNASLVFISVTFATMCKSAAPIFLLLFAFAFRLESPSFKLLGIMTIISVGILLTVAKEAEFEFWGFIFVMLAAVMSGFRWTMTQILLQKEDYGLRNPIVLMSHVTPLMTIATALLSFVLDPWYEFKRNNYFNNSWHIIRSSLLMLLGGTLAFFMVLTEYVLVSVTSAVTVTIAGVVKEAVTILVAVFYFHDEFTWLKGFGLFIIMVGVSIFNWYKYQKLLKGEKGEFDMAAVKIADGAKYVILEDKDDEVDVP